MQVPPIVPCTAMDRATVHQASHAISCAGDLGPISGSQIRRVGTCRIHGYGRIMIYVHEATIIRMIEH